METITHPMVYICSPYAGEIEKNVENAKIYSRFAALNGKMPLTPHLLFTQFLDDAKKEERTLGLMFGIELLSISSELWVFSDTISHGMKAEIEFATQHKLPIRFFDKDCKEIIS